MEKPHTKVLIIDDDAAIRRVATLILERAGYEVFTAPEGRNGIDSANQQNPDVVVCDNMMPGINGIETLTELKKDHPELEVVMLTANPTMETAVEALREKAFDYLSKPFDPERLVEVVAKAAARSSEVKDLVGGLEELAQEMGLPGASRDQG